MPEIWQKILFYILYICRRSTRKVFINRINGVTNPNFKGYQHVKNETGETVLKFNYPYNYKNEDCELVFYKVTPTENYNYKVDEKPIYTVKMKPEGVNVNLQDVTNLDKEEAIAYKVVRKDKNGKVIWEGPDTGVQMRKLNDNEYGFRVHQDYKWDTNQTKDGKFIPTHEYLDGPTDYAYTLLTRNGTTPTVQGAAYLAIPDSFKPGMKYKGFDDPNTGEIYYDKDYQKEMEGVIKSFSNRFGGGIAGLQAGIPYLKKSGYKLLFSLPTANGDDKSAPGYWNKNNFQVSPDMGNLENYKSFLKELYRNGMGYVYDGTFTSEGLEGIHFQYALRWANRNPQTYYWFRLNGLKDTSIGLGVLPTKADTLAHRIINAPYNYELQSDGTYKAVANPDYKSDRETLVQIYDKTQVSENQIKSLDNAIKTYQRLKAGNELDKITYDDTLINYVFQIDPKEYKDRINVINDLNKNFGKNIKLDTPDGTIMACNFSNFHIDKDANGTVNWDANKDMIKLNFHISGYDEKLLQAIPNIAQRSQERAMIERGTKEVRDLTVQTVRYLMQTAKDVQTKYTAQTVGAAKTIEALDKLIKDEKLPAETKITPEMLNNILNGRYMLAPKGTLDKDDTTVKALMELPLDALEFGENTVGVLSTSYLSNRATTDETIGVSRFDLMKQNNPHLVEPYANVYKKMNSLYQNELKSFADKVIKNVNDKSSEKLLDANGDYTEYGEYVINLIGKDIARYAFFKSLTGENLRTKILPDGEMTYDYDKLKAETTLKGLGINAHSPEDEAMQLEKKIEKGLKKLSDSDVNYVADAVSKQIAGTDTMSFRIAEALVDKSGLGLNMRLDAAKDVMDQDAIRNRDNDFDDVNNETIKFWKQAVNAIKDVNPNAYIVAELTDIEALMKDKYGYDGSKAYPYNGMTDIGSRFNGVPDFMTKLFNETGITTEAAYSYFFTEMLNVFARNFENGGLNSKWVGSYNYLSHDSIKEKIELLLATRSPDFLRNLYIFAGNHDKPRLIHGIALDMALFYSNGENKEHMLEALRILTNSDKVEDIPIELRLGVTNPDLKRTISFNAVAQSQLLRAVINEDLKGIVSEADIENLNKAIVDLTNGHYLTDEKNINYQTVDIKELSSLENAFAAILDMAEKYGLKLSDAEKKKLIEETIKNANSKDLSDYQVLRDLDWDVEVVGVELKEKNNNYAKDILGVKSDYNNYSLYAVQLARLLRDSYNGTNKEAVNFAIKDFVEKFDRNTVRSHTTELPKLEPQAIIKNKMGYARRDLRTVAEMLVKQVEYKTGKPFANKETVINTIYKSATEPAEAKAQMLMAYYGALFGIPQMYAGDEMGMTGLEEKAKNIYQQNRNVLPWTQIDENNIIGNYRNAVMQGMNSALTGYKSNPELHALNDGTPYSADVVVNGRNRAEVKQRIHDITNELKNEKNADKIKQLEEERRKLIKDLAKIAFMSQSANGDMTVSIFYAGDINHESRHDYFADHPEITDEASRKKFFEDNNIETINPKNKYIPIQAKTEIDAIELPVNAAAGAAVAALPVGAVFMNANLRDKARYVVNEAGKIVKEGGGKIILDGLTAKNGVMVLKHIVFKGRPYYNKKYHIASNFYQNVETTHAEEGTKLSIIAK